jgi:hypothetical protein
MHLGWMCAGGRLQPRRMAMRDTGNETMELRGVRAKLGSDEGRGTGAVSSQSGRYPCQHAGTVGVGL